MIELWIKFIDQDGEERRIAIDQARFTIGRHSSNDLVIASGKLSREHVVIERRGDQFTITDAGSSNGTEVNGERIGVPVTIHNRDKANLGGGLDVEFQLVSDGEDIGEEDFDAPDESVKPASVQAPEYAVAAPATQPAPEPGGFRLGYLLLAPLLGLVLVVFVVGLIYIFSGRGQDVANKGGFVYSHDPDTDPTPEKTVTSASPSSSPSGTTTTTGNGGPQPSPGNIGENAKLEQSAAAFLRLIAQKDPNAFLTADQSQKVGAKIKQIGSSPALADNINSARKSTAQIKSLATSKNLRPQLLATAALVKLGSARGDAFQAAQSMADVLGKLQTEIGCELSDDCLLLIAAFDQGQAGHFLDLRNMLQDLATKFPESSRQIRSIWFLEKQGKITPGEFDFALRFLAIGTITQSPKDFGINAEPLTL